VETWKILLLVAGASAAVTALVMFLRAKKEPASLTDEEVLKTCFGNPVYTDCFSMKETKEWLIARKDKLENGHKGIVMKATPEALRSFGSKYEIKMSAENYLIIAIVNMNKHEIDDSVLIKYNTLEQSLEQNLEKGDGVLVIGG